MKTQIWRWALMMTLAGLAPQAWAGDHIFDSGYDHRSEGPYSDAQAARFLTQATFGPSMAEIARLRTMGYNAWLTTILPPASRHRPTSKLRSGWPGCLPDAARKRGAAQHRSTTNCSARCLRLSDLSCLAQSVPSMVSDRDGQLFDLLVAALSALAPSSRM